MDKVNQLLEDFIRQLTDSDGSLAVDRFDSESEVRVKMIEFRMLLNTLTAEAQYLITKFDEDKNRQNGNLQTRLKMLLAYARTTLKLLQNGILHSRGAFVPAPDFSKLTETVPGLNENLADRWLEVQTAMKVGNNLTAIVLMGAILKTLLLTRGTIGATDISRAPRKPRLPDNSEKPLQEWTLTEMIVVAIDLEWLTVEPTEFPTPLRKYELLVNPYEQLASRLDVDTLVTTRSWQTLNKAVDDLLGSL